MLHWPCCGLFTGGARRGTTLCPIGLECCKKVSKDTWQTCICHDGNIHQRLWILSYWHIDILDKTGGAQSWQQGLVWIRRFPAKLKCDIQNGPFPLTHSCQLEGSALGNFIWISCPRAWVPLLRDERVANTQQVCCGGRNATGDSRNCLNCDFLSRRCCHPPVAAEGRGWQVVKKVCTRNFLRAVGSPKSSWAVVFQLLVAIQIHKVLSSKLVYFLQWLELWKLSLPGMTSST